MSEQRGTGRKPDVKIAIKPKQPKDARRVYIAAGWREDGKLRLKWDRDIAAVVLTDGTRLECAELYVDLYDDNGPSRGSRPVTSTTGTSGYGANAKHTAPADDDADDAAFGDDSIPF